MDIDLKNINISEIKDQITKLADKKTLKNRNNCRCNCSFLNNLLCNFKPNG